MIDLLTKFLTNFPWDIFFCSDLFAAPPSASKKFFYNSLLGGAEGGGATIEDKMKREKKEKSKLESALMIAICFSVSRLKKLLHCHFGPTILALKISQELHERILSCDLGHKDHWDQRTRHVERPPRRPPRIPPLPPPPHLIEERGKSECTRLDSDQMLRGRMLVLEAFAMGWK